MIVPLASDTEKVTEWVRNHVLQDLTAERRRRTEAMQPDLSTDDERRLAASSAGRALSRLRAEQASQGMRLPDTGSDQLVRKKVLDALFGLGPMQDLLDDPGVVEVNLIGCDQVWATYDNGSKRSMPAVMDTDDELVEWVRAQALYGGLRSKPWDSSNPIIEFELPGGHRLVGLMGCTARPALSIRLYRRATVTLAQLQGYNTFTEELGEFLAACIRARLNIMVSGETGSGKTTLLRALAAEIGPHERIITVEHFPELGLHKQPDRHPEVVALEERSANSEGHGALTMTQLVRTSRRLGPDRLIVGECVGEEVVDMLDAMTQGNDGGFTTIHARSARKVPERVATYAMRQGMTSEAALQLCASGLDIIVHMAKVRLPDQTQRRLITGVEEVVGFDGTQVMMNSLYHWEPGTDLAYPKAPPSESLAKRLAEASFDVRVMVGVA